MGGVEGEGPRGEPTAQQNKQEQAPVQGDSERTPVHPEQRQPLQGRAEGRQSLQGPTTVDRSGQQPHGGDVNRPEIDVTKDEAPEVEEIRLPGDIIFLPQRAAGKIDQERIEAHRASIRGATFFSAVGISEIVKKLKDQKDK
jgi:hypothetical protein